MSTGYRRNFAIVLLCIAAAVTPSCDGFSPSKIGADAGPSGSGGAGTGGSAGAGGGFSASGGGTVSGGSGGASISGSGGGAGTTGATGGASGTATGGAPGGAATGGASGGGAIGGGGTGGRGTGGLGTGGAGTGGAATGGRGTGGAGTGGAATGGRGTGGAGTGGAGTGGAGTGGAATGGAGTGGAGTGGRGTGGASTGGAGVPPNSIYALCAAGDGNHVIRFQATTPGVTEADIVLTGVQPGEYLVGIDFRASDKQLFGVGDTSRVYRIDVNTGAATAVSPTPFTPALEPTPSGYAGVSFIPGSDVLRVMNATAQNLRVSSTTGVATLDTRLSLTSNFPSVRDVAYAGTGSTSVLYAVEALSDTLVRSTSPNGGVLETVGPLGVNSEVGAFDIGGSPEIGYVVITEDGLASTTLSRINLATGALAVVGAVAKPASSLRSIALAP